MSLVHTIFQVFWKLLPLYHWTLEVGIGSKAWGEYTLWDTFSWGPSWRWHKFLWQTDFFLKACNFSIRYSFLRHETNTFPCFIYYPSKNGNITFWSRSECERKCMGTYREQKENHLNLLLLLLGEVIHINHWGR
jgi:hypothetical protein